MKRLVLIIALGVLGAVAAEVSADLCAKCSKQPRQGAIAKCGKCPGPVLGKGYKICRKCSAKQRQCQKCLTRISIKPAPTKRPVVDTPANVIVLSEQDNGRTITPRLGQRIIVRLAGNPTTDHSWSVSPIKGGSVRQISRLSYGPPGPGAMDGAGGVYTASFKGVRNGRSVLTMVYKRSRDRKAKPVKTFTVTIAVGGVKALSPKTARLARLLKEDIAKFTLDIRYSGPQDKPFYQLTLRVPIVKDKRSAFQPAAQLSQAAAKKIIDHLAADGFFDRATETTLASVLMPKGPAYSMFVSGAKGRQFYEPIGWDLKMLARLDALAKTLDGDPARKMALLLGRLSGLRKKWQADAKKPAKLKPSPPKRKRNAQLQDVTVP
ncbi:MAG: protease inhibitor I42 family protein [Phycisphaerae bacterium]|jgi:predicted secreted protein|nr:protease inhibitor I42 family protein [Phycisphaerae bacterium]